MRFGGDRVSHSRLPFQGRRTPAGGEPLARCDPPATVSPSLVAGTGRRTGEVTATAPDTDGTTRLERRRSQKVNLTGLGAYLERRLRHSQCKDVGLSDPPENTEEADHAILETSHRTWIRSGRLATTAAGATIASASSARPTTARPAASSHPAQYSRSLDQEAIIPYVIHRATTPLMQIA